MALAQVSAQCGRPSKDSPVRIKIDDRTLGIRRFVGPGDFRASDSGRTTYARANLDEEWVELAFQANDMLGRACAVFGFVYDKHIKPWLLEVSYGFIKEVYNRCEGHSNRELSWYAAPFDPCGWMVGLLVRYFRQDF